MTVPNEAQCAYHQKSQLVAFLLSFFVGWTGADYFYLGQTGIIKLLTCGIGGLILLILGACVLALCIAGKSADGISCFGNFMNTLIGLEALAGFGWWLACVIMIGIGSMHDGNGYPMQTW